MDAEEGHVFFYSLPFHFLTWLFYIYFLHFIELPPYYDHLSTPNSMQSIQVRPKNKLTLNLQTLLHSHILDLAAPPRKRFRTRSYGCGGEDGDQRAIECERVGIEYCRKRVRFAFPLSFHHLPTLKSPLLPPPD